MNDYTKDQIDKALDEISKMDRYTMAKLWRFTPVGSEIYFRSDLPTGEAFTDRFFGKLGGFSTEISKHIGWKK